MCSQITSVLTGHQEDHLQKLTGLYSNHTLYFAQIFAQSGKAWTSEQLSKLGTHIIKIA